MKMMLTGSICLSDLPKEKIVTANNGKKYLNLVLWINGDEPDKYGNHGSIQISQTKEERAAKQKSVYIGNVKIQGSPTTPSQSEFDSPLPF